MANKKKPKEIQVDNFDTFLDIQDEDMEIEYEMSKLLAKIDSECENLFE